MSLANLLPSHTPDVDPDYSARRMSSSVESDTGSLPSSTRPDKRPSSPTDSPDPKRFRTDTTLGPTSWSTNGSESPQPADDAHDSSPRVQLPSIASTFHDRHELRRASLPTLWSESSANRLRLPTPTHRPTQSTSGLSAYAFPQSDGSEDKLHRPRLTTDTQLGVYPSDYTLSSSSSFGFSPLSSSTDEHWATHIVRPNSTPGQISPTSGLRHPIGSSQQLFGGITRIAGHSHHHPKQQDWSFPAPNDYIMSGATSSSGLPSSTSQSMAGSPRSPAQAPGPQVSSLVERPPRKRGKLPKPVTDFLKDWLHRHSDHPYPSEEEKKQLCHATGLSMSQVSNWMINARRRILAPAHRAAQGPTTTTPFSSRSGPSVLDTGRRASMPTDSLQLYYPLSLQSLDGPGHMPSSTRHLVSMSRSLSSGPVGSLSATVGHHGHSPYSLDSYAHSRLSYSNSSSGSLHPSSHSTHSSGGYMSVPMSAPPISSSNHFLSSQPHQQQSLYSNSTQSSSPYMPSPSNSSGRVLTPHHDDSGSGSHSATSSSRYTFPEPAHPHSSSPQPGSGYGTPQ
ncbi:hypothetical protein BXZ70DRAFT_1013062 [Cristinia sonorae]|uniref:Homeobox domain-containing protein n=1 Tax=Cristinia sonorae TaxID=1940300 RepID=A0A8K0UE93_9AGAR|nr:hypothetical protein BXZ70DRAFT_1013062 [Cristinia sonorae]